jgi:hypothetical protein
MAEAGVFIWHVQCWDDKGDGSTLPDPLGSGRSGYNKRIENYEAHKKYQGAAKDIVGLRKIASGPMVTDDGLTMHGSAFVLEGTRDVIESFLHNDPFYTSGTWSQVNYSRYIPVAGIEAVPKL